MRRAGLAQGRRSSPLRAPHTHADALVPVTISAGGLAYLFGPYFGADPLVALRTPLRQESVRLLRQERVEGLSNPSAARGRGGKLEPLLGARRSKQVRKALGGVVWSARRRALLRALV